MPIPGMRLMPAAGMGRNASADAMRKLLGEAAHSAQRLVAIGGSEVASGRHGEISRRSGLRSHRSFPNGL